MKHTITRLVKARLRFKVNLFVQLTNTVNEQCWWLKFIELKLGSKESRFLFIMLVSL